MTMRPAFVPPARPGCALSQPPAEHRNECQLTSATIPPQVATPKEVPETSEGEFSNDGAFDVLRGLMMQSALVFATATPDPSSVIPVMLRRATQMSE